MAIRQIAAFIIFFSIALPSFADDDKEAMFGLSWGMTPATIKSLGVSMNKVSTDRNLESYTTASLPKDLSGTDKYQLIFSSGNLVKIVALGNNITNDASGVEGKERFDALNKSLQDKYGPAAQSNQTVGHKLYQEYDEFYQCLAYSGCGMWAALFETPTKVIGLTVVGVRRGTGYIRIAVEAVPGWSEASDEYTSSTNKADADAL